MHRASAARSLFTAAVLIGGLLGLPSAVNASAVSSGTPHAQARATDLSCPTAHVTPANFIDVGEQNVHAAAVDCVVLWRIANGRSPSHYLPAESVTREQMASFIARLVLRAGGTLPELVSDHFADDDASLHAENINLLASAGIIKGKQLGVFDPSGQVTRAQMTAFLVRAYDRLRLAHEGIPELQQQGDYFDDDAGHALEIDINRAAAAGFTGGTGGTGGRAYGPSLPVRRDQMASFLARVLDLAVEQGIAVVPFQPSPEPANPVDQPPATPTPAPPVNSPSPQPPQQPTPPQPGQEQPTGPVPDPGGAPGPVAPRVTVSASDLQPGSVFQIAATGFPAGTEVIAELHSDPIELGRGTTDGAGNLTLDVEIPADVPPGDHRLVVRTSDGGFNSSADVPVVVHAPPPPEEVDEGHVASSTISPSAVDVRAGEQEVTISAVLTDDDAGVKSATATLYGQQDVNYTAGMATLALASGDADNGTWQSTLTVPTSTLSGTFALMLQIEDSVGRWSTYLVEDTTWSGPVMGKVHHYPAVPGQTTLTVDGSTDAAAPQRTSSTISPSAVDVRAGEQEVTISAVLTDDDAGVKSATATLYGQQDVNYTAGMATLALASGDADNGTWQSTLTVPTSTLSGTFALMLQIEDSVGRWSTYLVEDTTWSGPVMGKVHHYPAVPGQTTLTVNSGIDQTGPELVFSSLSPAVVAPGEALTIEFRLTDATGVQYTDYRLTTSTGLQVPYSNDCQTGMGFQPTSGTAQDATYTATCIIPPGTNAGTYELRVGAQDAAGNWTNRTGTTVTVSGTNNDTVGPELVFSSLSPAVVAPGEALTIEFRLTDATGVQYTDYRLTTSTGLQVPYSNDCQTGMGFQPTSGTAQDATYTATCIIPPGTNAGTYELRVGAQDAAGNWTNRTGTTVTVSGTNNDTVGPELVFSSLSPAVVAPGEALTIEFRLTDATGVQYTDYRLTTSTGLQVPYSNDCQTGMGFQPTSGTAQDATYTATCIIPPGTNAGTYELRVGAQDAAGNWTNRTGTTVTVS